MEKQNFLSKVLQKYISNKDIREFKGNFFYYIFYRIIRKFLKGNIKVLICNFFINASTNKKICQMVCLINVILETKLFYQ